MTDRHEHLDEGTIHAWLDGELPPDESARVESLAAACTECAALVAEARGLVAASSRILSSLDAVPGGVIPGVESGTDQLAALRARRRETSRRWWNDRRVLAAASLVFVAGLSTMVWRSASNDQKFAASEQTANAVQPLTDSAVPAAPPASAPAEPGARDARVRVAPAPAPAPPRQVTERASDSSAGRNAAAANTALSRRLDATNESRRADSSSIAAKTVVADSISAQRAPQRSVAEVQMQGAPQGQRAVRQRVEQSRAAAPPAAFGVGARIGSAVASGAAADMAASLRLCYQLREPARADPGIIADSVRFLNETPMELSDPTWYRARAAGWADTALVWRSVDSTTVELRSRVAARPLVVRFSTTPSGFPLPEPGREPGMRLAIATRLPCP